MSDATPQLRVGDRERRVVDERLLAAVGDGVLTLHEYDERSALLWQARTRDELDALVSDLPGAAPASPRPGAGGPVRPQRVVAVMSEDRFAGALVPGQDVRGYAVMGKAILDLRREDLPDGTRVKVRSLMGEVEVQVPLGSVVHLSGMSVMGERKVSLDQGDGPVVHVDAVAVMGSVRVTPGDGTVVTSDGRSRVHPSPVAVPQTGHASGHGGELARSRHGRLAHVAGRAKGLLVPAVIVAGIVLAGPDATSIFGNTVERVQPGDRQVQVSVLFGNVEVVVPDGARVDTSGLVAFGNIDCEAACSGSGEVVEVRGFGAFGNVEVSTQSERAADQADDD